MGGEMPTEVGTDYFPNYDCYVNELGEVADSNQLHHPQSFTVYQPLLGHCWQFFGCWSVRAGGDYENARENVMRDAQRKLKQKHYTGLSPEQLAKMTA